jgi:hypothetical protein
MFESTVYSQESKVIPLKELDNPRYLIANKNLLLIEDNQTVKMIAMKDFKLIKSIGGKGEGPGEFNGFPYPQILSDSILIGSVHKVSFFDFEGNLIKEQKTKLISTNIKKINNKYISYSIKMEEDDFYISYNIYDSDFKKEKVLYKGKWSIHKGKKRDFFEIYFYDVHDDKIIFAHREGFKIEILEKGGKNLHTIKLAPPKIPFTDKDMKNIFEEMEKNFKDKEFVQSMKRKAIKPEYYPDIRTCRVADGKIYVLTYKKKEGFSECLIFNMKGEQLNRIFIHLRDTSPITTPPFTINNGHLYQLVENVDKEQWQLVIDKIE